MVLAIGLSQGLCQPAVTRDSERKSKGIQRLLEFEGKGRGEAHVAPQRFELLRVQYKSTTKAPRHQEKLHIGILPDRRPEKFQKLSKLEFVSDLKMEVPAVVSSCLGGEGFESGGWMRDAEAPHPPPERRPLDP
jgi:hypothetical protein